ncbi:MAG: SAM-dependent methyltransferase [Pelotomaculum sp.]|uniref:Predicted SAM-dependent methyltransferase n=1 Tax=Pelotomaculum thermopropionicum (strain DSM 13744 / JCM 10971 / SI) TaxID=370438 RepID=A5D3V2_PELTS|nr:SAM-dependent methyltransferase [Pelotomaculum sp.]BAF59094.1 predicted SAM-dependent methyltransferase [Pelotomaculum thermopropionicum SI]
MSLAKRLAALAEYVPAGSVAADIGTDHAGLPVYLVEEGICPKVIATDLNEGPFRSARRMVEMHKLEDRIDLRQGDGLKPLKPGEAEVLIVAGLGGRTVKEILAASPGVLRQAKRLILQPMGGCGELRAWLAENGWRISDEKLVEDEGIIYNIMVAEPGREEVPDPLLLELGPRLLEKKDPLMRRYLEEISGRYERALSALAAAKGEKGRKRADELKAKLAQIREVAKCL